MEIRLADILMLVAVLLAPLTALQVQVWLEERRAYKRRQGDVFRTLMVTRGTALSPAHIDALNKIDLEFYGRRIAGIRWQSLAEKAVVSAWRAYHSHLGEKYPEDDEAAGIAYFHRRHDLLHALLRAMAVAAGYDFDETHLKEMCYTPKLYGNVESDQTKIREGLAKILSGEMHVPVQLSMPKEAIEKQEAILKAIQTQVGAEGVLRVRIVQDETPGAQVPVRTSKKAVPS